MFVAVYRDVLDQLVVDSLTLPGSKLVNRRSPDLKTFDVWVDGDCPWVLEMQQAIKLKHVEAISLEV